MIYLDNIKAFERGLRTVAERLVNEDTLTCPNIIALI